MFPETHEFLSWADSVPPYSQTAAEGIPNEAYVHTIQNEVRTPPTILLTLYFAECQIEIRTPHAILLTLYLAKRHFTHRWLLLGEHKLEEGRGWKNIPE